MWKKIARNNNYSINEKGEVRNDKTNRIKRPFENKSNGYMTVDLYKNNKSEKVTIHRLLAEAFIPNPEKKKTVDHIDGNRKNNALENLRWATYSENNSRFQTVGVRSEPIIAVHYGEERKKRGGGHIAWLEIIEQLEFQSISEAAEYFKCTTSNISLLLEKGTIGRRGRTRGYRFTYKRGTRSRINS